MSHPFEQPIENIAGFITWLEKNKSTSNMVLRVHFKDVHNVKRINWINVNYSSAFWFYKGGCNYFLWHKQLEEFV